MLVIASWNNTPISFSRIFERNPNSPLDDPSPAQKRAE